MCPCGSGRRFPPLLPENRPFRRRTGRLVKIYAESIRQLTLDHLELEAKLNTSVDVITLADRGNG